jgi:hypothetical protein
VLRVPDVADDRVELGVRDRVRREPWHHVRTDPDGLGDLHRRRILERRRHDVGDVAALGDDLMAACAVLGEQVLTGGKIAALRVRMRNTGAVSERGDVGDQRIDLARPEQEARAARLDADPPQGHVAGAQVEICGERPDAV